MANDSQNVQQADSDAAGTPPQPAKARKRRRLLLGILAILVVAGGIAGTIYWLHARQYEETDDAFIDGEIVQISAKVSGTIQSVEVKDNQDVAAGTVLFRIDPSDYEVKLRSARAAWEAAQARKAAATANVELVSARYKADVAEAQAGVKQAKAGIQSRQSQIESAKADVAAATAEATRRQADLARYESLDPRAVSRQQLDAAKAAAEAARANLAAAKKRVLAAESALAEAQAGLAYAQGALLAAQTGAQQVAVATAQRKQAQAAVDAAASSVAAANLDLAYTVVRAPVAGRITRRTARPGQYLQVGQLVLAIVEPDVWVTANFKENQIGHMRRGQDVDIKVDAYPDQVFHGKVDSIQAGSGARFSLIPPENATGNYVKVVQRVPVKILLDPEASRKWLLAPGMSVVPRVHVGVDGQKHPLPIDTAGNRAATTGPATTEPATRPQ